MSLFERIQNKRYDLQEKATSGGKSKGDGPVRTNVNRNKNNKTPLKGGFEDITGEGPNVDPPKTRKKLEAKRKYYEIDPKTRKELEAKRKEYGINKDGVPSKEGIKRYAEKAKQLKSGSNIPVNVTQDDLDKAKRRMVGGEPIYRIDNKGERQVATTTGKYGGRLAKRRSKNAPSYAEVKKKIDAKNPVIQTPIGPLPKTAKNMKKFPKPTFKSFTKNLASKGGKYLKNLPMKNKLGLAALGTVAAIYGAKKLAAPPKDTLTARDFKKSKSPVTKKDGSEVRRSLFLSTKQEKNNKEPRISGDRLTRNKNFTAKIKSGEYRTS